MNRWAAILALLAAALLEAGGDALLRFGLLSYSFGRRAVFFAAAMIVLFAYGWMVNAPPWEFGRLLGLYVVFFFVIAQLLSWLLFQQPPTMAVLLGGGLIVCGGLVIACARA